jgi:high affinity Mn2+ porin
MRVLPTCLQGAQSIIAVAALTASFARSAHATVDPAADQETAETSSPPTKWGPFYSPIDTANWQANFQSTYIWQRKPSFKAAYTGPNSLVPTAATGYTLTATLFLGFRPWTGAEIFFNPEASQSLEISHLAGLGGLANGENQKSGGQTPSLYVARLFLRQTLALGGASVSVDADANHFAATTTTRRLVLTAGNYSVTDVFDANTYSHDPRTSFLNWALWTYGASDFAADARGYTWGLAVEYYHDDWAFRLGRFAQPEVANGLPLDDDIFVHYGDVLEIEHDHVILGMAGQVRVDGFHNRANMGRFRDALAEAESAGGTPATANVRHTQSKLAFGIGMAQAVTQDAGLFARFSYNDGQTETYAYADIQRSLTVGATLQGRLWRRPYDTLGVAYVVDGISRAYRAYLGAGGLGPFIGDGQLRYGLEHIIEGFYSFNAYNSLWFSLDGQYIINPAYNRDRGPAGFFGCRFHIEY